MVIVVMDYGGNMKGSRLKDVLDDKKLSEQMGEAGRKFIEETFR